MLIICNMKVYCKTTLNYEQEIIANFATPSRLAFNSCSN